MPTFSRSLPTPLATLFFLATFICYYLTGHPIFEDNDLSWHLAAGDFIRSTGALPQVDPWSFTAGDARWYNLSWLWDIFISWLASVAGLSSLFYLTGLILGVTVGLLFYCLRRRPGVDIQAAIIISLLAIGLLWAGAFPRPQLITYFFAVLFHFICHSAQAVRQRKWLMLLPVLMALWVNLHGGFVVGIVILGAYGLEAIAEKQWVWLRHLLITGITCLIGVLITPYGLEIFPQLWLTLSGSEITQYISEWAPFSFTTSAAFSLLIFVMILISNFNHKQIPIADKILAFVWTFAAMNSVRHFPILMMAGAPYLAYCLTYAMERRKVDDDDSPRLRVILAAVAVVAIGVIMLTPQLATMVRRDELVMAEKKVPLKAIAYLHEHYPNHERVLNDYDLGGYLIYFGKGEIKPFIDGRANSLYPESVIKDFLVFNGLKKGWQDIADSYKTRVILVRKSHAFNTVYDQGAYRNRWKLVYEDDIAAIYVRIWK